MPSALIYTDAYVQYQYSDTHPLKPYRLRLTHELMQRGPGGETLRCAPAVL